MLPQMLMEDIRRAEEMAAQAERLYEEAVALNRAFRELGLAEMVLEWQRRIEGAETEARVAVATMEGELEEALADALLRKRRWEATVRRGRHVRWTAQGAQIEEGER